MDATANTWGQETRTDEPRSNEPKLTVFFCERCCALPSPPAGATRCHFVPSCANEVDATRLRDAYADGSDGVMILGCLGSACCGSPGEVEMFRRIHAGSLVLQQLGLEPARLRRHWLTTREAAGVPALVAAFRRRLLTLSARREARAARTSPPAAIQAAQA